MKPFTYIFLVLLLTIFTACESDDGATEPIMEDPLPLEALTLQNVSYGNDSQQVYDLYLPANRDNEKTKVIILVHGGGWIEGAKEDMNDFISLVRDNNPNHAIVNMNYRLAVLPSIPAFPNQFLDIDAVINKLTTENESLQILPEFALIGASAGAHLSLQYDSVYDTDDQVKFVGNIVGPTDFTDPFYSDDPLFNAALAFFIDESQYPANTDFAVAVSPALQINQNTSPTIMFYGNQDDIVPLSNGDTLNAALEANDIAHQYTVFNGGHGDWSPSQFDEVEVKLTAFINSHLPIN